MTPEDERRGSKFIATAVVLWALSAIAVALRAIAIRIRKSTWKSHDYLTALTLAMLTFYLIDVFVGIVDGGYGWNITTVPMDKLTLSLKVFFASEWFFTIAVASFRLAILCFYLELFRGTWFRWSTIVIMVIVVLYLIASLLTITLLCRPIRANWDVTVAKTCGNVTQTEYASAGFNLAVDLLIVTLPMPIIWQLQMPKEKKVGVTVAFLFGLVTAGVNIARIMQTKLCEATNVTYCALDASILIAAEISCGILVSCAPTLGPLIARFRGAPKYSRGDDHRKASDQRALRTFGSSGRSWPRRKLQLDTTLLGSVDEDLGMAKNGAHTIQQTQIVSREGEQEGGMRGEIRVQSERCILESAGGERGVGGEY
ncbi:uncharacterized protein BP01DRAFT_425573 [Aspergillus saccharolyticus JOP 1030-1]|uniref:Rhodopsin domain-containing protein n=1 Tax=Aspergillus saccharolyticus JOP 1030-1 TaxID=1450539 RepID=A0A318Z5H9_9EURO|nr:hypothetical protein BP01DRAFT_425573 [Aspergillus saccharolyticus JOP 1030-1]PYH42555.1 hypothetical protein BP01DRAFT_425573 [Aspergillus saccharolyticus JOP 1030-1]